MPEKDKFKKFEDNILKTGFPLEYRASKILVNHNWVVLNNRYYVDDVTQTPREIDLLAYRSKTVNDFHIHTTLLISCKKSEDNIWAFLTKDAIHNNPYYEVNPVTNWTNNRYIKYFSDKNKSWINELINTHSDKEFIRNLYLTKNNVFAFQEMAKEKGSVQNDKAIYNSISGLVKASAYELESLNKRKKENCLYNFNLITLADTDMIELKFSDTGITSKEVDCIHYVNRHIVYSKDDFFKIIFINIEEFEKYLENFNHLSEWNAKYYSGKIDEFFDDVLEDDYKIEYQKELLSEGLLESVNWVLDFYDEKINDIDFRLSDGKLDLIVDAPDKLISVLNENNVIKRHTLYFLKNYFRFTGEYKYVRYDLPF